MGRMGRMGMRDRSREKEGKRGGERQEAEMVYGIRSGEEGGRGTKNSRRGAGCVEGGGAGARARVGGEERVW